MSITSGRHKYMRCLLSPSIPSPLTLAVHGHFLFCFYACKSGRGNMAFKWLNYKEHGYRDLVVGDFFRKGSVVETRSWETCSTDLVARSSVVKGSVVKEPLVEIWTCSFATIQIIAPCYFSAGSEPRSRRCGWRVAGGGFRRVGDCRGETVPTLTGPCGFCGMQSIGSCELGEGDCWACLVVVPGRGKRIRIDLAVVLFWVVLKRNRLGQKSLRAIEKEFAGEVFGS